MLTFRPATEADAELLFGWANDPLVRAMSFSPESIEWEDHCRWLTSRLRSDDCRLYIAVDEAGIPVGQIRFDRRDSTADIDVSVAADRRHQGWGRALIAGGISAYFAETDTRRVRAVVKTRNAASQRAFLAAGFHPVERRADVVTLEYGPTVG